jgi:hypothetical protein
VVRASSGFDVTNPGDGTRYEIRPSGLTIRTSNGTFVEPMEQYAGA